MVVGDEGIAEGVDNGHGERSNGDQLWWRGAAAGACSGSDADMTGVGANGVGGECDGGSTGYDYPVAIPLVSHGANGSACAGSKRGAATLAKRDGPRGKYNGRCPG